MLADGCRRLCALVFNLPAEGALAHSAGQDWTVQDELAAAAVELSHAQWLQLRAANGDKRVRDEKPFRVQHPSRPGAPKPKRVSMGELMKQGKG